MQSSHQQAKNWIIINHNNFFRPLLQNLEDTGLELAHEHWHPTPELLEKSLACFIWFYDALRHPLKVFVLRQRLHKHGVPLIAWNRDAPHYLNRKAWRLNLLNHFRLFDIYATHTLIDDKRQFANLQLFLPNAANPKLYNLRGPEKEIFNHLRQTENYQYDVSFFGGMDGQRHKEDLERQHFFEALGQRLEQLGISCLFVDTGNEGMPIERQIEIIQKSRINLSYGARCEYLSPVASGLPERFFGIPACGGFLLGDKRTHTKDNFEPEVHMSEFSDLEECISKIQYYLEHFDHIRDMAEKAYYHVIAHHTYKNRADKLVSAIHAWHQGKKGLIR